MRLKDNMEKSGLAGKLYFKLLPVQSLIAAFSGLNGMINTMMAGRIIGVDGLAPLGLFAPVVYFITFLSTVFLIGSQILCGKLLGKNQCEHTNGVFSLDLLLCIICSVFLNIIMLVFSMRIARLLGGLGKNQTDLAAYMRGFSFSLLPQLLYTQLVTFLQMENIKGRTYVAMFLSCVSNIFFDIVFLQYLKLGLFGLGLASSFANYVFLFVLLPHYLWHKHSISISFKSICFSDTKEILKIGAPGAVLFMYLFFRAMFMNGLLLKYGNQNAIAAFSVYNSISFLVFAISTANGVNVRILSSIYVGEEDRSSLLEIGRTALIKGFAINFIYCIIQELAAGFVAGIFISPSETEAIYYLTLLMRIIPLYLIFGFFYNSITAELQCRGYLAISHVITFLDGFAAHIFPGLFLARYFGVIGIWFVFPCGALITVFVQWFYSLIKNKRVSFKIEDYLLLSRDFNNNDVKRMDLTISNMDAVTQTSKKVMEFCDNFGVDLSRSYKVGLCLEEISGNIVKHGFSDGKKHKIDIRVSLFSDELLLRISDDCMPFDPKAMAEMLGSDFNLKKPDFEKPEDFSDSAKNLGIRIVYKIAKEMLYNRIIGLNVLTIKI